MDLETAAMLQKMVDESDHIVFFGGAGVSTESGIPDFRSRDGLFRQKYKYSPQKILSKPFYKEKPEVFYEFYREKMLWPDACPNAAHKKLVELEEAGKLSAIVTQNIDGLHQKAGSKKVLELHGSVHRNYCTRCGKFYDLDTMLHTEGIPRCSCGGMIKPDVVLYQEKLKMDVIMEAAKVISEADMLIIGGTSLSVYPANRLIKNFKKPNRVLINKNIAGMEYRARLVIADSIGEVLGGIQVKKEQEGQAEPPQQESDRRDRQSLHKIGRTVWSHA